MRIYEYAKKIGLSSKELLEKLIEGGYNFASHMSVLTPEAEKFVEKKISNKSKSSSVKNLSSKKVENKKAKLKAEKENIKSNKEKGPVEKNNNNPLRKVLPEEKTENKKTASAKTFTKKNNFKRKPKQSFVRREFRKKITPEVVTEVMVQKDMPLFEVAKMFGKSDSNLIFALLKKGIASNRNNVLSTDTIKDLASFFGIKVLENIVQEGTESFHKGFEDSKGAITRWPIIVVMGHVDHGKTTLLDYIRKINTAAHERGGITQHIGAYEVDSVHGKIIFLDTPGHEAFSYLREKGAKITDIAVLVVAADDGIMPQTIEAINYTKKAKIPIIVAINKIDKPGAAAGEKKIKRQLAEHDIIPEDWGGDTICVPISAKTGQGVEELLEMITLQAQMMDLKADPKKRAKAFVLESKMEKGYGPVATVICTDGTLKQDDFFICGQGTGKVRLLINSFGKKIKEAEPSIPVQVVGFDDFVSIGEWLEVVDRKDYLKAKSGKFVRPVSVSQNLPQFFGETKDNRLNIIIKSDTHGSKEALLNSFQKISKQKKDSHYPINVISQGIGDISEGDILLAEGTGSQILGLHIKVERNAIALARKKSISIKTYDVIYHMIEDLEKLLKSKKVHEVKWSKTGQAVIRKVFNIKKIGIIAGSYIQEGVFSRGCKVECLRKGIKVGEGKIVSLQREKNVVKEVHSGYECGFICDGYQGWEQGDTVKCYKQIKEQSDAS